MTNLDLPLGVISIFRLSVMSAMSLMGVFMVGIQLTMIRVPRGYPGCRILGAYRGYPCWRYGRCSRYDEFGFAPRGYFHFLIVGYVSYVVDGGVHGRCSIGIHCCWSISEMGIQVRGFKYSFKGVWVVISCVLMLMILRYNDGLPMYDNSDISSGVFGLLYLGYLSWIPLLTIWPM